MQALVANQCNTNTMSTSYKSLSTGHVRNVLAVDVALQVISKANKLPINHRPAQKLVKKLAANAAVTLLKTQLHTEGRVLGFKLTRSRPCTPVGSSRLDAVGQLAAQYSMQLEK